MKKRQVIIKIKGVKPNGRMNVLSEADGDVPPLGNKFREYVIGLI